MTNKYRSAIVQNLRGSYHASPKPIAPRHSGDTLTAAEGESRRCLSRKDLGGGAGFIAMFLEKVDENVL